MSRQLHRALLGALLAGTAACSADKLQIPNYNNPTTEGFGKDPNGVQLLVSGLLDGTRDGHAAQVSDMGRFGRESYNYFPTDGRTISHYITGIGTGAGQKIDPGGFASGLWNIRYGNMKNAVNLLEIADQSATLNAAGKAGVQGFAKTMRALELLYVVMTRDSLGGPVEITTDPNSPAPFVSRDAVYQFVSTLLDEAKTSLGAAGASFPFTLHSGFTGFNTPATFLRFNRALAARTLVYRATLGCGNSCYTQALTALGESFITPIGGAASLAALETGVNDIYSATAGDTQNGVSFSVANFIFAHASAETDVQKKTDATNDDRYVRKVTRLATPVAAAGNLNIAATHRFLMYPVNTSPIAIIRNEELIFLRAEANIALGNAAAALQDINNVRQVSGGLPALTALGTDAIGTMLRDKRYSLLFEGLRWVDMRRFNRLSQLPIDRPGQFVAKVMPIPLSECDARTVKPNGC